MKNDQFGRLINYSGESLDALRNYTVAHEGNLVFGHITNSDGEFYYIYANSTEMKIPTKKQFDQLYEYVGKIPAEYTSTNIVDFIKEYVAVTSINPNEKIISLEGTELSSTLSIAIEKKTVAGIVKDCIVLKGIDGVEIASIDLVSADDSITLTSTESTLTFDYTGVATADDWAEIGNE